VINKFW